MIQVWVNWVAAAGLAWMQISDSARLSHSVLIADRNLVLRSKAESSGTTNGRDIGRPQGRNAMKKSVKKLSLYRETLRHLGGGDLRLAAGGLSAMSRCVHCDSNNYCHTDLCQTGDTAGSCPAVFSCGSCILATCPG
jgi:hypothetical protein